MVLLAARELDPDIEDVAAGRLRTCIGRDQKYSGNTAGRIRNQNFIDVSRRLHDLRSHVRDALFDRKGDDRPGQIDGCIDGVDNAELERFRGPFRDPDFDDRRCNRYDRGHGSIFAFMETAYKYFGITNDTRDEVEIDQNADDRFDALEWIGRCVDVERLDHVMN